MCRGRVRWRSYASGRGAALQPANERVDAEAKHPGIVCPSDDGNYVGKEIDGGDDVNDADDNPPTVVDSEWAFFWVVGQ